jgi:hypothetical protein
MAMRETEQSLRAYLIVAGALSLLLNADEVSWFANATALPASWRLTNTSFILANLVLGVGWIWAGVRLPSTLPTGAHGVRKLLLFSLAVLVAEAIVFGAVFGDAQARTDLFGALLKLGVAIYLLANLRRLAHDAMMRNAPVARAK